jgi:hypothetical protein
MLFLISKYIYPREYKYHGAKEHIGILLGYLFVKILLILHHQFNKIQNCSIMDTSNKACQCGNTDY